MARVGYQAYIIAACVLGLCMEVALAQDPDAASPAAESAAAAENGGGVVESGDKSELTVHVLGPDEEGTGVSGAKLYIKYDDDRREDVTNSDGIAVIGGLPRGKVTVMVTAPGWETFGKHYQLENDSHMVKVRLTRQTLPASAAEVHTTGAATSD